MSNSKKDLTQRLELPDTSCLEVDDIPEQAGNLTTKQIQEKLRVRKNSEETVRSVIRGVQENLNIFEQADRFDPNELVVLLEQRQRLQPIREKIEEAYKVISDAELIVNDSIQRNLLRAHEIVQAAEKINSGIARDFTNLKEYMKTSPGRPQSQTDSTQKEEDSSKE